MSNLIYFADEIAPITPSVIVSAEESSRMGGILSYLFFFLISTIIIEAVVALILGVRGTDLRKVILAQIITNPPAFLIPNLIMYGIAKSTNALDPDLTVYYISVAVMEIAAIVVEYIIYKNFMKKQPRFGALAFSLICNFFSFLVGLVLMISNVI